MGQDYSCGNESWRKELKGQEVVCINHKSDFDIMVDAKAFNDMAGVSFADVRVEGMVYGAERKSHQYPFRSDKGKDTTHCTVLEDGRLRIILTDHRLPLGLLRLELVVMSYDSAYPGGVRRNGHDILLPVRLTNKEADTATELNVAMTLSVLHFDELDRAAYAIEELQGKTAKAENRFAALWNEAVRFDGFDNDDAGYGDSPVSAQPAIRVFYHRIYKHFEGRVMEGGRQRWVKRWKGAEEYNDYDSEGNATVRCDRVFLLGTRYFSYNKAEDYLAEEDDFTGGIMKPFIDNLEGDIAGLSDGIDAVNTDLSDGIDAVNTNLSSRIHKVNTNLSSRIHKVDTNLSSRIDAVDTNLSSRVDEVDTNLSSRVDEVDNRFPQPYRAGRTYTRGQHVVKDNVLYYVDSNSTNAAPPGDDYRKLLDGDTCARDFGAIMAATEYVRDEMPRRDGNVIFDFLGKRFLFYDGFGVYYTRWEGYEDYGVATSNGVIPKEGMLFHSTLENKYYFFSSSNGMIPIALENRVESLQERMTDAEENIEDVQKTLPPKRKVFEDCASFCDMYTENKKVSDDWKVLSDTAAHIVRSRLTIEKHSLVRCVLTNNTNYDVTVRFAQYAQAAIGEMPIAGCDQDTITVPANTTREYDYRCVVDGTLVVGISRFIPVTTVKYPCIDLPNSITERMVVTVPLDPMRTRGGGCIFAANTNTTDANAICVKVYDLRDYAGRQVLVTGYYSYLGYEHIPYVMSRVPWDYTADDVLLPYPKSTNRADNTHASSVLDVDPDYPYLLVNGYLGNAECSLIATTEEITLRNAEHSDEEKRDRERIDMLKAFADNGYVLLLKGGCVYNGEALSHDTWGRVSTNAQFNALSKEDIIKIARVRDDFANFSGCGIIEDMMVLEGSSIQHLTNLGTMFYYCQNLKRIDISSWDMTGKTCGTNWVYGAVSLEYITLSPKFFATTSNITFAAAPHLGKDANFEDNGWLAHLAEVAPIIRTKSGALLEEEDGAWYLNDGVGRTITLHNNIKNAAWASEYIDILTNKGYTIA